MIQWFQSMQESLHNIITRFSGMMPHEEKEQATESLSMEYLIAGNSPKKMRCVKPVTILCSSTALVCTILTMLLIWMVR